MKKIFLVLSLFVGISSFAQSNLRLAHFDYEKVTDSLPTILTAKNELETLQNELKTILDELQVQFDDAQIIYERQKDSLSPVLKEIKEKGIQAQYQDIMYKQEEFSQKYQARATALMEPIESNLKIAIKVVAQRNKLNYVFEANSLMYVNGGLDLTNEVKLELIKLENSRNK